MYYNEFKCTPELNLQNHCDNESTGTVGANALVEVSKLHNISYKKKRTLRSAKAVNGIFRH